MHYNGTWPWDNVLLHVVSLDVFVLECLIDCKQGVFSEYGSPGSMAIMLNSMMFLQQHMYVQSTTHTH